MSIVSAGSYGAIVGETLGSPHKGRTSFTRLAFYDPIPIRMAPHESLDAWWVWLGHLRAKRGRGALGATFYAQWSSTAGESAYGLANLALGFGPTMSGRLRNPLGEGSSAFGRALFWGLACHGDPDEAVRWAYNDAGLDHHRDGLHLAACLAWMTASAKPGVSPSDLASIFTRALPVTSVFLKALPQVIEASKSAEGVRVLRNTLPESLGIVDDEHAALSMSWIVASLLAHPGAFGPSLLTAVGCGGAADQTGMAVGAISALLAGEVGKEWLEPLGAAYVSSHALRGVETSAEIAEFVGWIEETNKARAPQPEPVSKPLPAPDPVVPLAAVDPTTDQTIITAESQPDSAESPREAPLEAPAEAPIEVHEPASEMASAPSPSVAVAALIRQEFSYTLSEQSGVELAWNYLDEPILGPHQSLRMSLTFTNVTDEAKEIVPELHVPERWKSASRLTSFRLPARGVQSFPLVLQSPDEILTERAFVRLRWGSAEYRSPLLPAQMWHLVGPFVNHEGTGYQMTYPAEGKIKIGQVFNGRSDLPVKWEGRWFSGTTFDLEPEFKSGPGAILLWARVRFGAPGRYRLMAAASVGTVVTVDGTRVLGYHDDHKPNLHRREKYMAEFATTGESDILIKVLRNKKPIEPLYLSFFTDDGQVVHPVAFLPMP